MPSDRPATEHYYSSSSHRLTTAKSARPRTIKRMPPPPSAFLWGIGAISFWRRRRNKPRRKFVGMRGNEGGEIKYGTESSAFLSSPLQKRTRPPCHENAEKGCGKKQARQSRAFLFYIHEISCPPLYFIALPLRPAASSSRAAPHGRTQDSRIA